MRKRILKVIKLFGRKSERMTSTGRTENRWEDKIKTYLWDAVN
jgi:hypothetical protein